MTHDAEVVELLRQAVDRVGAENLGRRPGLARNVLGDLLPHDQRAVSLLSTAAENGSVARLQEQSDDDIDIVAPRLAAALAANRALVPEQAQWAIDTWAAALGLNVRAGSHPMSPDDLREERVRAARDVSPAAPITVRDGAPDDSTSGGAETLVAAAKRDGPPRGRDGRPLIATEPPATAGGSDRSAAREKEPRRWLRLGAVAVVVGAVALAAILVLALASRRAPVAHWSFTAVVQPKAPGALAQVGHDMSAQLGSKPVKLADGDQVEVTDGPVEILLGDSLVRLDDSTTVDYRRGTSRTQPLMTLGKGSMWVNLAPGQRMSLRTPNNDHADLDSGRFFVQCVTTCMFETIDEPQLVHSGGYSVHMTAHQRFTPSTSAAPAMPMPMPSSTSSADGMGMPTASAGDSSSAMPMPAPSSSDDPNAPRPVVVAPDVLANTPWISQNIASDKKQGRHYDAVGGRSLLGMWTFMFARGDVGADVHRAVRFSVVHCTTATCVLTAHTDYLTASGAYKSAEGRVDVSDAAGNDVTITYDEVPAVCRTFGNPDGMQRIVDTLRFDGTKPQGTGTRSVTYLPMKGSACTSSSARTVADASIAVGPHSDLTHSRGLFTAPGASERLVLQHIRDTQGACSLDTQKMANETADTICRAASAKSGGPRTIAYYSFANVHDLRAAYESEYAASGRAKAGENGPNGGDCNAGACEHAFGNGRLLIFGDAYLVQTDEHALMMVVANGTDRGALAQWHRHQTDYSFTPLPTRGL